MRTLSLPVPLMNIKCVDWKDYLPVALLLSALPIFELYKCSKPLSLAWNWRAWSENALIVIENAFFKSFIYSTLEKLQTEMEKDWDKIQESTMLFSINEICYVSLKFPIGRYIYKCQYLLLLNVIYQWFSNCGSQGHKLNAYITVHFLSLFFTVRCVTNGCLWKSLRITCR